MFSVVLVYLYLKVYILYCINRLYSPTWLCTLIYVLSEPQALFHSSKHRFGVYYYFVHNSSSRVTVIIIIIIVTVNIKWLKILVIYVLHSWLFCYFQDYAEEERNHAVVCTISRIDIINVSHCLYGASRSIQAKFVKCSYIR